MCRSIHTLYHIDSPVTAEDIHAASVQFVRKISGYNKPSKVNEVAFNTAVGEIEAASAELLAALVTNSPVRGERKRGTSGRVKVVQTTAGGQPEGVND